MFDDNLRLAKSETRLANLAEGFVFVLLLAVGVCAGNLASVSIDNWRNGVVTAEIPD